MMATQRRLPVSPAVAALIGSYVATVFVASEGDAIKTRREMASADAICACLLGLINTNYLPPEIFRWEGVRLPSLHLDIQSSHIVTAHIGYTPALQKVSMVCCLWLILHVGRRMNGNADGPWDRAIVCSGRTHFNPPHSALCSTAPALRRCHLTCGALPGTSGGMYPGRCQNVCERAS